MINLSLTREEAEALKWCLTDIAHQMDDDGNEGAFDASPLKTVWHKLKKAAKEAGQ